MEYQAVNQTFRNILTNNLQSLDNLTEIIIVFLDLLNRPQLDNSQLNRAYISLSENHNLFESRNDFIISITIRAYDVILLSKDTLDAVEVVKMRGFKDLFRRRIAIIGDVIYIVIVVAFVFISVNTLRSYHDFKDYVTDVSSIFQIAGFAFIAAFKFIRKKIGWALLALFGYNKTFQ